MIQVCLLYTLSVSEALEWWTASLSSTVLSTGICIDAVVRNSRHQWSFGFRFSVFHRF